MEPPFPGMLAPFVHEMDVIEEAIRQKITVAIKYSPVIRETVVSCLVPGRDTAVK